MAVLLHKWELKNIEVAFLKVSEKILSPGLQIFWQYSEEAKILMWTVCH